MASSLDHIEKTLADAYRKEIDQEENIWRSLPFFAATLALQLTALSPLFGLKKQLPSAGTGPWLDALGGFVVTALMTVTALTFLVASVWPARFRYIAPEPDMLDYAEGLDLDEQAGAQDADGNAVDAVVTLKKVLARQYAVATHHNRQINQRRALWRSFAGLAILVSVFATLWTVANVTLR